MLSHWRWFPAVLLLATLAFTQTNPVENFDLTGLPAKATNFAEQHLMNMIERHKPGDTEDATVIQQQLAQYYRQKGDTARARVADERAHLAGGAASSEAAAQNPSPQPTGEGGPVVGEYACRSMGSRPCDTQTTITLRADGTWGWRYFSGRYEALSGQVTFQGVGLGSWGAAEIGPGTLTFTSGGQKVIFERPGSAPSSLPGSYRCAIAPGGCQTRMAIKIRSDGTWSWGAQGGSYSTVGNQVKFRGLSSGPAGWGLADIGPEALIFRTSHGASEWKKQR